jgi:hypothetical protein
MLSNRATEFLRTLERRPAISTKEVETIILDQGLPCFAPWLDFHERYAGYCERFGRDGAIWGLVQENPQWLPTRKAEIDRESHEETWYITCADAHPSYMYRLDNRGEFLGTPAESFDIHVERIAVGWDFDRRTSGQNRVLTAAELGAQGLLERVKPFRIAEASDRYFRYYMTETGLVVEDVKTGVLRRGRVRILDSGP